MVCWVWTGCLQRLLLLWLCTVGHTALLVQRPLHKHGLSTAQPHMFTTYCCPAACGIGAAERTMAAFFVCSATQGLWSMRYPLQLSTLQVNQADRVLLAYFAIVTHLPASSTALFSVALRSASLGGWLTCSAVSPSAVAGCHPAPDHCCCCCCFVACSACLPASGVQPPGAHGGAG